MIDWLNGCIIDWVSAGQQYSLDGQQNWQISFFLILNLS
jgi:hypothetical protein